MSILLMWGPHAFEAGKAAYEDLARRVGGRWRDHDIIGRRPAGQYLGPAKETYSLRGCTYLDMGGAGTIDALMDASIAGKVYTLVSGMGEVFGVFRLERASTAASYFLGDGRPQKITYDLEFCAHDDGDGSIWSIWP